jgi:alpha-L-fucosidase
MLVATAVVTAAATVAAAGLAVPTPAQLEWANSGYGAFVHYNMGTYVSDGGGCNVKNLRKDPRQAKLDPNLFAPEKVDTDQWLSLIKAYGGKYAVLTVKHNCGFLLYPSNTTLPDGTRFNYSVAQSSYAGGKADIVADFVASCKKHGIRPGFYFSLASSAIFDVSGNEVQNSSLVPGQVRVTQAQYEQINLAQLEELWSTYQGDAEIWFDGGFSTSIRTRLRALLTKYQPNTPALNGFGVSKNPLRWIMNEAGHAPDENWSTGSCCNGGGMGCDTTKKIPGGVAGDAQWCPSECPFTMQNGDTWFYDEAKGNHSMPELRTMFHETVGHNCNPIFDYAPAPSGQVTPVQAAQYKAFGSWIDSCYGTPAATPSGTAPWTLHHSNTLDLSLPAGTTTADVDRVWL